MADEGDVVHCVIILPRSAPVMPRGMSGYAADSGVEQCVDGDACA